MVDPCSRSATSATRCSRPLQSLAAHHGGRGAGPGPAAAGTRHGHPVHCGARRPLRRHHAGHRHRRPARAAPSRPRRRRRPARWARAISSRPGGWTGCSGRRCAPRMAGRPRQPRPVLGPAAVGRPEDVALVQHQRRRGHALRRHPAGHRRRRPPPGLGLGRRSATSVAEWRVRTELADDGLTHRVVHLEVLDKQGGATTCAATCCGWPTSAGRVAPWSTRGWPAGRTRTRDGGARTGYGICEYLHQLDDSGRPVVPVE